MDFNALRRFERINVVGTSGSGKSTFARELAKLLELPFYEMDALYWKPDWQGSSDDELTQKVRDVASRPRWVLDGNYTRTIPDKWKHVQLVIWLDLSFARTVVRVTKRAIHRSFTRQELWPGTGNRESLGEAFLSKKSIIWWSITSYRRNKRNYSTIMAAPEYSHIHFLRLTSPTMVKDCLEGLGRTAERFPAGEHELGESSCRESVKSDNQR